MKRDEAASLKVGERLRVRNLGGGRADTEAEVIGVPIGEGKTLRIPVLTLGARKRKLELRPERLYR